MALKTIPIKTKYPIDNVNESHWKHLQFIDIDTEFTFDDNDLAVNVVNNITNNNTINNRYGILSVPSVSDLAGIDTALYFDVVHVDSFHNHRLFGINESYGGGLFHLVTDANNPFIQSGNDLENVFSFRSTIDPLKSWVRIIDKDVSIEMFGCKDLNHIQPIEKLGYDTTGFMAQYFGYFAGQSLNARPTLCFERKDYYQNSNSNITLQNVSIDFQDSLISFENFTGFMFIGGSNLKVSNLRLLNLTPSQIPENIFFFGGSLDTCILSNVSIQDFATRVCFMGGRTNIIDCKFTETTQQTRIRPVIQQGTGINTVCLLDNVLIQTNSIFVPTNDVNDEICVFLMALSSVTAKNCYFDMLDDMPLLCGYFDGRMKFENCYVSAAYVYNNIEGISETTFSDCFFRADRLISCIGKYNTLIPILPNANTVLPNSVNPVFILERCVMPVQFYFEFVQCVVLDGCISFNKNITSVPNIIHCALCDKVDFKNVSLNAFSVNFFNLLIEDCRELKFHNNSLQNGSIQGQITVISQSPNFAKCIISDNTFRGVDFFPNQQGFINLQNAELLFIDNYVETIPIFVDVEFIVSNNHCFFKSNHFILDRLINTNFFIECFDVSPQNNVPQLFLQFLNNDFLIINPQQGVTDLIGLDSQQGHIFSFVGNNFNTDTGQPLPILHTASKNNVVQNNLISPKPLCTDATYFEVFNKEIGINQTILDAQNSTPYLFFGSWFMY
jgi:hypothetical protein